MNVNKANVMTTFLLYAAISAPGVLARLVVNCKLKPIRILRLLALVVSIRILDLDLQLY